MMCSKVKKEPPYRIAEEGWGEFEMFITFTPLGKGTDIGVTHDLNFLEKSYDNVLDLVSRQMGFTCKSNC
jgi:transcription initiation factor IIF auxiliary subunit